jgi:hypothetical protein
MNNPIPEMPKTPIAVRTNGHAEPSTSAPPPDLPIDVRKLSSAVLRVLALSVPQELERREAEVVDSLRTQAEALGISPERLALAIAGKREVRKRPEDDRRHVVKPLLWNPKDHAQRWSKRGAAPKWYSDHLAAGGTEEECVIPEGAV